MNDEKEHEDEHRTLELRLEQPSVPDFMDLLENPTVDEPLPSDFDLATEVKHLSGLWDKLPGLWHYDFQAFVHAGGSGMVFRALEKKSSTVQALKVARSKLLQPSLPSEAAETLSPVPDNELLALQTLTHPHVVSLHDAFSLGGRVVAISTTYVDAPQPLDSYLSRTLAKTPKGVHPFSPIRLEGACAFLIERCTEIADALAYMHGQGIYHFDVKPANVLVSANRTAVLTDLGACIHQRDFQESSRLRVHFTWTYAHPELTTILHDPGSISGGGLKASAEITPSKIERYDLFAFGRTLQQSLAILESEFGERSYAASGFRFLHLIAAMLLDGKNAPNVAGVRVSERDGRRFVADSALDYPASFFSLHKITSAKELLARLRRFSREFSLYAEVPELDAWQPKTVNTGLGEMAPFTERVAAVLSHPALRRLKSEPQLGWVSEVFPGATHDRWSHTIGVFGALVQYYNSLLSDPDVPTLRVILDRDDLAHAMVAAVLHDVGQIGFGHDLEAACPHLFRHEDMVPRLLEERVWGQTSLRETLLRHWPNVDVERVLSILRRDPGLSPVDWLAADVIDGPIDADKFDYLQRDAAACGVSYGKGFDSARFLRALSVDAKLEGGICKLGLAYRAKGAPAIESLLLVRYQMYGAVYWHHTFRCIQAMFAHAASTTFGTLKHGRRKLRYSQLTANTIRDLLYHWVLCGKTIGETQSDMGSKSIPRELSEEAPSSLNGERVLEFVWKFSNDEIRELLELVGARKLFKRVFELKVGDLGSLADYSGLRSDLQPENRPALAEGIQEKLLNAVYSAMQAKGPIESLTEGKARERHQELQKQRLPLVVIDFPVSGIPNEINYPTELGDPARKYLSGRPENERRAKVFHVVRELQTQRATLRVFAARELHELVIRYLAPSVVEACVSEVVTRIRQQR